VKASRRTKLVAIIAALACAANVIVARQLRAAPDSPCNDFIGCGTDAECTAAAGHFCKCAANGLEGTICVDP
jgi:hypothetical protein